MYFVYALYNNKFDKIYIGQTEDLKTRLHLHDSRVFERSYTARLDGEWKLIYVEEVVSRQAALRREKQLKTYRGREFVRKHIPA